MNAPAALLRGRRRAAPLAVGLGVLAVVAIAVLTLGGSDDGGPGRATSRGGNVAEVTRQTLVDRETVEGTLGYSGQRTVINRLGSGTGANNPDASTSASTDQSPVEAVPAALFTPAQSEPDAEAPDPDSPDADTPDPDTPDPDTPDPDTPAPDQPSGDQPSDGDADQPSADEPEASAPQSARPSGSDTPSADGDSPSDGYDGSGTVTALARAGSVVERGGVLYRLDGDPIVLMYGSTPAYRDLSSGIADGRDVLELEQNLTALGFDPGTVDETFTSQTAAAVSDWQESVGLEQTASVELGRVVFQPGPRRIGEHKTSVGSVLSAGAEVLETSSTRRVVTIELDATLQSLAAKGEGVEVTLPDGSLVRGRISNVGRVAREVSSDSADPGAEQELVIDVTVKLRSSKGLGKLDEAPVGVGLAQESRKHVLAVPVNALLSRRGGGYGLELADSHRIVPVEAGLFAGGYVEVSGPDLQEGTRVVVAGE